MKKLQTKKGFTLIELLVVIAIIGVLASVVLASLNTARRKSRDARRVADIKQIQLALEMYYDSNAEYPDTVAALASTYLPTEPKDPSTNASYPYGNFDDNTLSACAVADAGSCAYYHLGATLEGDAAAGALLADRDLDNNAAAGTEPDGISTSAACAADAAAVAATDKCYDMVP